MAQTELDQLPIASDDAAPTPSSNPSGITTLADRQNPTPQQKKVWDQFRASINSCKTYRRKLIQNWTVAIDYRRGKPFASQTDEDRIAVPIDWSLTKAKQASLFSQVPQIRVDHAPDSLMAGPWVAKFEHSLNDKLIQAGIEAAMNECLPDVINAAGIGAVLVAHESLMEEVELPITDPSISPEDGTPQPITIPRPVDSRYTISRISPADLLWPINFTGSDFDSAPWIGRTGRISWAQAVQRFGLTERDKDSIMGEERTTLDRLTHDIDKDKTITEEMVGFDEVFYKEFQYNPEAKSYSAIHHLVFIQNKDEPVIDEPWKGQKFDPTSKQLIGALKSPLRILTLTYITDETIPPSDSAMGRSQVNEINKGRTQMIMQRERSLPIRTVDINRIDPIIMQALMRGTWQTIIPVQGAGDKVITEVARSSMPQENFTFDRIAKSDLNEIWQVGPNQDDSGAGIETKAEADIVQSNFTTRVGQERARVAKFVIGIAEVLGGLMCLYEDPNIFGQGFTPAICKALSYSILADSTVILDSQQKLQRLMQFVNFTAKSGWVNLDPVLREIAQLSGLDPNVVIQPPQPKPPVQPNISLRLTGTEDLMNPLALAMLMKSGQAPPPELIEQAKRLIAEAISPMPGAPPNMPPPLPGPGAPNLVTEQIKAAAPGAPPLAGPAPVSPPAPPAPQVGEAHPNWSAMNKINKRTESGGTQ